MVPNIFVSSTIADLSHLRDIIRETIMDLGFNAIMSEYGDIGYLPSASAIDSCYKALRDCQIVILIVGKRYGSIADNGLSVTHNEFNTAKKENIPLITLVEQEVLTFGRVYDANRDKEQVFPGMDKPENTFRMVAEIKNSPTNNGIVHFVTPSEARDQLKKQLAHYIGDILRRTSDPIKYQIKDVLSELKTLRHELREKDERSDPIVFLRAVRFLIDDRVGRDNLGNLAEGIVGSLDDAVPTMLQSESFDDFLSKCKVNVEMVDKVHVGSLEEGMIHMESWLIDLNEEDENMRRIGQFALYDGNRLQMNKDAKNWFDEVYKDFLKYSTNITGKLTTG